MSKVEKSSKLASDGRGKVKGLQKKSCGMSTLKEDICLEWTLCLIGVSSFRNFLLLTHSYLSL